jgi:DNA-directed RNA polymerase subunit M/transcription elongation factor TFIIS
MAPSVSRPTSPPPPKKKGEWSMTVAEQFVILTDKLVEAQVRNRDQQQERLLLLGQIESLTERLGKHECPDCGDAEQIVDCHHEGNMLAPECNYRHCNGCGHQWGHN